MRHKSFNDVNRDGQAEDTEVQPGAKYLETLAQPSVVVEEKRSKAPRWCFRKAVSQSANCKKKFQCLRVVTGVSEFQIVCDSFPSPAFSCSPGR